MNPRDDPERLLVDPAVLARLCAEFDDDEGWLLFLQRFLAHLPPRVQKLCLGLLAGDHAVAMDAVLSLKISSQMVGAQQLAGLAEHLQQCLEATVHQKDAVTVLPKLAAPHLAAITACARQTAVSLTVMAEQADSSINGNAYDQILHPSGEALQALEEVTTGHDRQQCHRPRRALTCSSTGTFGEFFPCPVR